ncbi:cytochrome c3 family protein [Azoarcus sp. KH32C]|uniref:cytochrome c3 family protein n=1 Tax=Azoarcus sp. KH32C TaxID=748247 RepID=UPI00023863F8|nr:cytochrome c3 family protein [Azoarcus sp. KH32C]BAL25176.1 hypothetical protein AZKH_2876 [Azoarcus sp. KH32C]
MTKKKILSACLALATVLPAMDALSDGDVPTKFSNMGTISNTRHNLTQRDTTDGNQPAAEFMDFVRNDYMQVCVYCHTPHGANTTLAAPLWNRTNKTPTGGYTLYNQQSLSGTVTQPGPNSLTCLSCHDGQTAIDSIVNMPGSGGWNAAQMTTQDNTFLNTWPKPARAIAKATSHNALSPAGCLSCHSPGLENGATDFSVFAIGTDLSNDHPVGVKFPTGTDWNPNTTTKGSVKFFDTNGNSRPDKNELRFYDSGDGYEVECASCHDPHGVPSAGVGTKFLPTFLRVTPEGSTICLTCHVK